VPEKAVPVGALQEIAAIVLRARGEGFLEEQLVVAAQDCYGPGYSYDLVS
jgi:hypothetical protein